MLGHRSVHKVKKQPEANASTQKRSTSEKKMEANASTLIHSKRKQNVAGGQCLHTEAFTKYTKTAGANASTQKRSKTFKTNEANASTLIKTKRCRRPMLARRNVHKVLKNSRGPMLAHRSYKKMKIKMEANASTLIHSKSKQHIAGCQCLHTEAFTKYKQTAAGQC
jgi:hypothetical protein